MPPPASGLRAPGVQGETLIIAERLIKNMCNHPELKEGPVRCPLALPLPPLNLDCKTGKAILREYSAKLRHGSYLEHGLSPSNLQCVSVSVVTTDAVEGTLVAVLLAAGTLGTQQLVTCSRSHQELRSLSSSPVHSFKLPRASQQGCSAYLKFSLGT